MASLPCPISPHQNLPPPASPKCRVPPRAATTRHPAPASGAQRGGRPQNQGGDREDGRRPTGEQQTRKGGSGVLGDACGAPPTRSGCSARRAQPRRVRIRHHFRAGHRARSERCRGHPHFRRFLQVGFARVLSLSSCSASAPPSRPPRLCSPFESSGCVLGGGRRTLARLAVGLGFPSSHPITSLQPGGHRRQTRPYRGT